MAELVFGGLTFNVDGQTFIFAILNFDVGGLTLVMMAYLPLII